MRALRCVALNVEWPRQPLRGVVFFSNEQDMEARQPGQGNPQGTLDKCLLCN